MNLLSVINLKKTYGVKTLFEKINFSIEDSDKIGVIGVNGTGKSSLLRIVAGQDTPDAGEVRVYGSKRIEYLAQTPELDPNITVLAQVFRADTPEMNTLRDYEHTLDLLMRYPEDEKLQRHLLALTDTIDAGGLWNLKSQVETILTQLGIRDFDKTIGTLSGGQRRRIELARILFSDADTLILDEPTNHLDADSIEWLRGYLKKYEGGFLVISHSTELLDEVVNKVWHLDAQLGQIDMYSLSWKAYLHQRVVDEERRRREREVAEKKAERLMKQGIRLHAKASKAVAAQNMMRRAEKLLENTSEAQKAEKVADIRFPEPAPCCRTPIMAKDISKAYGSNIVFAGVNLAIDKGSRVVILGYNGAGKTTTLRLLAHIEEPDTGSVEYGHGCKIGYFAQEHDTLDLNATVLENLQHVAPELDNTQARSILGSFLFSGDDAMKPAHVLSGGEKTRLALATLVTSRANVLLLDEPTNNLDPASREEILKAIAKYEGAIVLVTHDEGAVEALNPERVLLMPDGDEDLWNDSYLDLVAEE